MTLGVQLLRTVPRKRKVDLWMFRPELVFGVDGNAGTDFFLELSICHHKIKCEKTHEQQQALFFFPEMISETFVTPVAGNGAGPRQW